jgi:predicted glycosyltransferase
MKILVQLNHPAHYHLFKNIINYLKLHNHDILITSRNKDVLEDLLIGIEHISLKSTRGITIIEKFIQLSKKTKEILEIVKEFRPDFMIGTAGELGTITRKLNIPSFFFSEDDVNINIPIFLGALYCYPFFTAIISPEVCYNSIWNRKTIKYPGYQKLAYLHPNHFVPDPNVVLQYLSLERPFFLLRFSQLDAYHDFGIKGLSFSIVLKLIEILLPFGDIYISSEKILEPELEHFRIRINPKDIHHFLYYATIFIGDSQSMAVESAILGTPNIRFNDFVGKISVLEELEKKYGLTFGIKSDEPERLYQNVRKFLCNPNIRLEYQNRREKMLSDKIDVTAFVVWFIENFPESRRIMQKNPNYVNSFR